MSEIYDMSKSVEDLAEITASDREYYIERVRETCVLAAKAANPAIASVHLIFASTYVSRLLTSIGTQVG